MGRPRAQYVQSPVKRHSALVRGNAHLERTTKLMDEFEAKFSYLRQRSGGLAQSPAFCPHGGPGGDNTVSRASFSPQREHFIRCRISAKLLVP